MAAAFLILSADGEAARDRLAAAAARLAGEGAWRPAGRCGAATVWTPRAAPSPVLAADPDLLVLGRGLFGRSAGRPSPGAAGSGPDAELGAPRLMRLLREAWGEYVALARDRAGGHLLLRDPSGGVEGLTWRTREGLAVAADALDGVPAWLSPPRQALNWDRIAAFLNATSAGASASLFDGVDALPPGAVARLGDGARPRLAWRPAEFVGDPVTDLAGAAGELVRRVDAATAGLVEGHPRLVFELSGGLDSSIVAASLAAVGGLGRVATWYNGVGDRPEGDERAYARAVTDRLGVTPTFVRKRIRPLTEADFTELARGFRPATSGVDAGRDRDMVALVAAARATAVLCGQGGDAAFYQMPSSWLVTDLLRRDGLAAVFSPGVAALARRRRAPAWRILREALEGLRRTAQPPRANRLLTPAAAAHAEAARHPWEADSLELPLAKQLQVRGLAQAHATRSPSRRAARVPLLCPLMAQPVTELCLAIPAVDLALGVQDRPFARRAFAARLPPPVRERRSKGAITAYFARLMFESAEALRPFLADGVLAEAGVLDRDAVVRAFAPETLIHAPRPSELLMAAATEAWVRYWQTRVPDSPQARRGAR